MLDAVVFSDRSVTEGIVQTADNETIIARTGGTQRGPALSFWGTP